MKKSLVALILTIAVVSSSCINWFLPKRTNPGNVSYGLSMNSQILNRSRSVIIKDESFNLGWSIPLSNTWPGSLVNYGSELLEISGFALESDEPTLLIGNYFDMRIRRTPDDKYKLDMTEFNLSSGPKSKRMDTITRFNVSILPIVSSVRTVITERIDRFEPSGTQYDYLYFHDHSLEDQPIFIIGAPKEWIGADYKYLRVSSLSSPENQQLKSMLDGIHSSTQGEFHKPLDQGININPDFNSGPSYPLALPREGILFVSMPEVIMSDLRMSLDNKHPPIESGVNEVTSIPFKLYLEYSGDVLSSDLTYEDIGTDLTKSELLITSTIGTPLPLVIKLLIDIDGVTYEYLDSDLDGIADDLILQ